MEQALMGRLGYDFKDITLLLMALTHSSADAGEDNQRLEYLGDAVLQLCVSQRLFLLFPEAEEGMLSRRRASLVREESLAEAAQRFGIGPALRMGQGEAHTGGRDKPSVLADAMEAVIAAVYLDGGLKAAQALVDRVVVDYRAERTAVRDAKTVLQEYLQAQGLSTPVYRQVSREGPDHAPQFTCEVISGGEALATGAGGSKKAAEQQAASAALMKLGQ